MTRPRSTYVYDPQSVMSPDGAARLVHAREDHSTLALFLDEAQRWSTPVDRPSPKQLFVADDGTSAVLDAADLLSFRDPDGQLLGETSLIEAVGDGHGGRRRDGSDDSPVGMTTAGDVWDDYLAGSFLQFEASTHFIISGRGATPLVFDPTTLSRVDLSARQIHDAQRSRAPQVLAEAANALAGPPANEWRGHEPWRMAAVGWARVAGETGAPDAVASLETLARLDMVIAGMTHMPAFPQPKDPIRVNRYALDPLRQAVHIALLRMGRAPPPGPVMQLARRRGVLAHDWVEYPTPTDWIEALQRVSAGIMPTALVDLVGPPTHVATSQDRVVWSYDFLEADGAKSMDVRWGKKGAEAVSHAGPIPVASPRGRLA